MQKIKGFCIDAPSSDTLISIGVMIFWAVLNSQLQMSHHIPNIELIVNVNSSINI